MTVTVNTLIAGGAGSGGGSTIINNITQNFITNNSYTQTGNQVVSGGGVVLTGTYGYTIAAASYNIQGTNYTSPQTNGTLTTADPTNPRIDVFVLTTSGTATVLTGTPAVNPVPPVVDPTLYVETGFVLVPANNPPVISNALIYLEDTEWTMTSSGSGITLNSTANPYQGTVNVQLASVASGSYWQAQKPTGTIQTNQFNSFVFAFYPTTFANAKSITIQLYNAGVPVGVPITFKNGSQAFNTASASYQVIVYDSSVFGSGSVAFNQVRFTVAGSGAALSGSFDYCFFQGAVATIQAPAPMVWRGLWTSTSAYNPNDVVTLGTGYYASAYVSNQANVNQTPSATSTYWTEISAITPPQAALGSGTTNITHDTHANRPLYVNQAGATTAAFAGTATSGALAGDEVYILNIGAGVLTLTGVTANAGFTNTIQTGVQAFVVYNSANDTWYSQTPAAYLEVPYQAKSADYTAVLTDSGKGIDHPSTDANARTFTIPSNASVPYPTGTCLTFSNMTSNVVTIAITSDTLYLAGAGTTGSRSLAQYGHCTARKIDTTAWLISGPGLT